MDIEQYIKLENEIAKIQNGGHVIKDKSGTSLTQRPAMKISGGLNASDDGTNEQTIIDDIYETIPWSTWETYTEQQKAAHPNAIITNAPGGGGGGGSVDIDDYTIIENSQGQIAVNSIVEDEETIEEIFDDLPDGCVIYSTDGVDDNGAIARKSYVDAVVNVYGAKNLNKYPSYRTASPYVLNGITWTVNSDGSINASGTVGSEYDTSHFVIHYRAESATGCYLKNGNYKVSILHNQIEQLANDDIFFIFGYDNSQGTYVNFNGFVGNLDVSVDGANGGAWIDFNIYIKTGVSLPSGGITFKPMIRDARIPDDTYVPYAMTNKELTDEVAQLNSNFAKHTLGSLVDMRGYIQGTNWYTTPTDGYFIVATNGDGTAVVGYVNDVGMLTVYGSATGLYVKSSVFVKQGMRLAVDPGATGWANFCPLQ